MALTIYFKDIFVFQITMNFTYIYAEDPLREKLQGNITWLIPEFDIPAHWMHTEDICKFLYIQP